MWKQEIIDLGKLKVGKPASVEFVYLGTGIYQSSKVSCGCTSAIWETPTNKIKSTYTPKPVPAHLKAEGKTSYNSTKTITVTMVEGKEVKQYSLQIKAEVHE